MLTAADAKNLSFVSQSLKEQVILNRILTAVMDSAVFGKTYTYFCDAMSTNNAETIKSQLVSLGYDATYSYDAMDGGSADFTIRW